MSSLYIKDSLVLIDFGKHYYDTVEELLSSDEFKLFIEKYIEYLADHHSDYLDWMYDHCQGESLVEYIVNVLKIITVINYDSEKEISSRNAPILLEIVETAYQFWRKLHRFSYVISQNEGGILLSNFISADGRYNELVLSMYRMIQEKLQGFRNNVYRQLQAGSNGSILLCMNEDNYLKGKYEKLHQVPFVQKIMLRSPIIINLKHNKRIGTFTPTQSDPLDLDYDYRDFMCFPIFVGTSLTFVYFHKDFTASAVGLANLFEFASFEHVHKKPDCIILFGVKDDKKETVYYHDDANDVYVGKISYMPIIEYFGYFKKMALTLHNLNMIKRGLLPIHGAMLDIYLKDGTCKGVCLMGDSGAGKSETIEALNRIADEIERQDLIFDDMGTMYINPQGQVVAIGTEIGAFVRLDDLDATSAYKDLDRSIFFNPGNNNSRVITPSSTYKMIMREHKVDIFLYANNYDDKKGIRVIDDPQEAKEIYIAGKRYAIGTTNEKGYSETYFANPFGPMQEKEECQKIIDQVFDRLAENGVALGELYSNLGLKDKGYGGIDVAARALLDLIKGESE